jgi:voltage-gated potassium channel
LVYRLLNLTYLIIDSFCWSIVTVTTVGYGDITPTTAVGRTIAVLDMLIGIGILATLSATIASILVDPKMREDLGMKSYEFQNHMIICEWNPRAKVILHELRHDAKTQTKPIVLIADIDRKPVDDPNLYFVQGQVSDETLNRANLAQAETVVILGDDRLEYTNRDAKVVLSTLTVESINRNVYTIVELVNEAYISTCQRAHADEIIVGSQLSSHLISTAALHHGMSKVVSDILSYEFGSQLYKIPVPPHQTGKTFLDLVLHIKQQYQSIAIAVQQGKEGQVISHPPADYQLTAQDYLIVIATATRPSDDVKLKQLQNAEADR